MFEEFLPKNKIGVLSPLAAIDNVAAPGIWQVATVILTDCRGASPPAMPSSKATKNNKGAWPCCGMQRTPEDRMQNSPRAGR